MFLRERKLPFKTVIKLLLKKGVKPLQLILNEWTDQLDYQITASALSQAKNKLKHTVFIELLNKCVIDVMYRVGEHERYKGKRLLALDCTTLRLPNSEELRNEFGILKYMNGKTTRKSNQVEAQASVLYDLLNKIPISGYLFKGRTNEAKTGLGHLVDLKEDDLLIGDRAYVNYRLFAEIIGTKADFLIRCKKGAFEKYHNLFGETDLKEKTVEVFCPKHLSNKKDLPESLKLRFIRVVLKTGEVEVLVTSLTDKKMFPHNCFKDLYYKRWGIETYFYTLKSRLILDNFTGKTVNAIKQDFYATLYISGLETLLSEEANEELASRESKYPQKVNKSIAFHTIKNKVVKLIFEMPPGFELEIMELLLQNPTLIRGDREKPPRRNSSSNQNRISAYFQKYSRKHVY